MLNDNNYYVYIYLNPLKKGNYNYSGYNFEFEPFYVGLGKNRRYKDHLSKSSRKKKHTKNDIINEIISYDLLPIIIKIKEGMSPDEAFSLEIKMISIIGRIDLEKGPLSNRTNGGDSSGFTHTEKTKRIASERMMGDKNHFYGKKRKEHSHRMKKNNPMKLKEVKEKHWNSCHSKEFIENAKKRSIGENNPFFGKNHTKETKLKLSKGVYKIDMETLEVIEKYNSISDAGGSNSSIVMCCRGKRISSGNHYWEYVDEELNMKYKPIIEEKRGNILN